ncbi:MAG: acyl-CoA dehydrogenase family protein, partial [Leptospiraceae bacterium]|nr:acyl-CoA dehydrogenase family protein [Leptospiraceae bacterium]
MPQYLTDDQIQIRDLVREFAQAEIRPIAAEYDEKNQSPMDLVKRMRKELGINGMPIEEKYGGMGYGTLEVALMTEELSRACLGITLAYGVTFLGILPIMKGATDDQKKKWFGPIVDGDVGVSFCLSEPGAGSDVPGMSTTAVKKGDKYIL